MTRLKLRPVSIHARRQRRDEARVPLFAHLDGSAMSGAEIIDAGAAALERWGGHPAHAYAMRKVGYMVSDANYTKYSAEELAAWQAALDEYQAQHPDAPPAPPHCPKPRVPSF